MTAPAPSKRCVIGIDLGTTNSAVAAMRDNELFIIPNRNGERTTPSVVAFRSDSEILIGTRARNQGALNPSGTIFSTKRLIGKLFGEVAADAETLPYRVVADMEGRAAIAVDAGMMLPEEVAALLLAEMAADAESYLGTAVDAAVIAVPAHFGERQKDATRRAAECAGLDVAALLPEPNASAMVYGIQNRNREARVLVFDLGGGTLDVSLLESSGGMFSICALSGDNHLGGDDWDARIVDWICDRFSAEHPEVSDLRSDPVTLALLKRTAEAAKIELSFREETRIALPFIAAGNQRPYNIDYVLSRAEFELLTSDFIDRCQKAIDETFARADVVPAEIDEVVLVGGSTRMPAIKRLVSEITGAAPHDAVNPDEAVALGAALHAEVLCNGFKGAWLTDATSLTREMRDYMREVSISASWWKFT